MIKHLNSKFGTYILLFSLLTACELLNPEEPIPSYIYIESFELDTESFQGSSSEKITEAWLTVDEEFLGAYRLPISIPILKEGEVEIKLEAGIKDNGITATPEIYPFYAPYRTIVNLKPTETVEIRPRTTYLDGIDFAMVENFEQGFQFFTYDLDGNENTNIIASGAEIFEGGKSGRILLTPENPIIEVATDISRTFKDVTKDGIYVYLELNYKTEAEIAFGLLGTSEGITTPEKLYEPILFKKDEWNKVYINLTSMIFSLDADEYQVAILSQLPDGMEEARIWLDNIKLIHF